VRRSAGELLTRRSGLQEHLIERSRQEQADQYGAAREHRQRRERRWACALRIGAGRIAMEFVVMRRVANPGMNMPRMKMRMTADDIRFAKHERHVPRHRTQHETSRNQRPNSKHTEDEQARPPRHPFHESTHSFETCAEHQDLSSAFAHNHATLLNSAKSNRSSLTSISPPLRGRQHHVARGGCSATVFLPGRNPLPHDNMSGMHRPLSLSHPAGHAQCWHALLLLALLTRALIPAGFMPVRAATGGLQIVLCSGYAQRAPAVDHRSPAAPGYHSEAGCSFAQGGPAGPATAALRAPDFQPLALVEALPSVEAFQFPTAIPRHSSPRGPPQAA
jgi:hypothetical protein